MLMMFALDQGRTVRTPDVKAFPDRFDSSKRRWLLTFTIKDDVDTIDIKFWHKSQEHLNSYSNITVSQKKKSLVLTFLVSCSNVTLTLFSLARSLIKLFIS